MISSSFSERWIAFQSAFNRFVSGYLSRKQTTSAQQEKTSARTEVFPFSTQEMD